jgi:hypothetical protein
MDNIFKQNDTGNNKLRSAYVKDMKQISDVMKSPKHSEFMKLKDVSQIVKVEYDSSMGGYLVQWEEY